MIQTDVSIKNHRKSKFMKNLRWESHQAIYFGAFFAGNLLADRFFSASKMKAGKKKKKDFR